MHFFWCLLIKVNHLAFNKNLFFWPENFCVDCRLAGFPENIAISAPNSTGLDSMPFATLQPTGVGQVGWLRPPDARSLTETNPGC